MSALAEVVEREQVDIAIIAVPAAHAQVVADELVAAGVTALLNLALVQLKVSESVRVVDERIVVSLQELAYLLRTGVDEKEIAAT